MYRSTHRSPTTTTIRLEDDTRDRLDKLAEATQRSRSFLGAEAIRDYIELSEWQTGEIREVLKEADRREFASDAEVKQFFEGRRNMQVRRLTRAQSNLKDEADHIALDDPQATIKVVHKI